MSIARIKAGSFCFFVMAAIALTSCRSHSDFPSNQSHALKDFRKVRLNHGVALLFEDEGSLASYHPLIEQEVRRTIEVVAAKWDIGRLSIRVFASQTNVIPEIGLNGYTPSATEIRLFIHSTFQSLDDSIETHLFPLLAHEMHHARRTRLVGYGSTLLEAVVSEGLADHFSMEVAGVEPPVWSVSVQGETLDHWIFKASEAWLEPGYRHAEWFYGTHPDIPRWTSCPCLPPPEPGDASPRTPRRAVADRSVNAWDVSFCRFLFRRLLD